MSVIIKGMDMPKGNEGLVLVIFKDGKVYSPGLLTQGLVRKKNAEAISVPTPHGRLIDVDKADEYAYDELELANGYLTGWEAARAMQKIYQSASTVIEAEEG